MQKIAILGGTFNPIHNGHLHLIKRFSEKIGFDRVILIPTKGPTHKGEEHLADAVHRVRMCQLAAKEFGYEVSDMEVQRETPSYTVLTLEALKHKFPNDRLYFITGEDMFLSLLTWNDPARIFQLATICSAPRSIEGMGKMEQYAQILKTHGANTILANIDFLPISSTLVRTAWKNGEDISGLVPAAVVNYMKQYDLYKE